MNPRTPERQGPQPCAFDLAWRPPPKTHTHPPTLKPYPKRKGRRGESNPGQGIHSPVCYRYTTAATQRTKKSPRIKSLPRPTPQHTRTEPAIKPRGARAPAWLVGTGPGTVMAPIFIAAGPIGASASPGGYAFDAVRNIEDITPDHDSAPRSAIEIQTETDNSESP